MRFLVLYDQPPRPLLLALDEMGHRCDAFEIFDGLEAAIEYAYSVVILDGASGSSPVRMGDHLRDHLRDIRESQRTAAVIVLVPETTPVADVVGLCLQAGADDVVRRDAPVAEVIARGVAVSRRRHGFSSPLLQAGDVVLDVHERTVSVRGRRVDMSHTEIAILELLMSRRGDVISRETVYDALYGARENLPDPKTIDVFIHKVRQKIAAAGGDAAVILTVWGRGYTVPLSAMNLAVGRPDAPVVTAPASHCPAA